MGSFGSDIVSERGTFTVHREQACAFLQWRRTLLEVQAGWRSSGRKGGIPVAPGNCMVRCRHAASRGGARSRTASTGLALALRADHEALLAHVGASVAEAVNASSSPKAPTWLTRTGPSKLMRSAKGASVAIAAKS